MSAGLILVCFALPEEAKPLRKLCRDLPDVRVLVTGMGRMNTERAVAAALREEKPALVLTCGFAGGLDPALKLNTVLFETTDAALAARLRDAGLRPAKFHCATRMAVTAAEKAALRRETGADAVEMESEVIHTLCRARGIPCATVRVISDAASEDLPLDFNQLSKPDLSLDYGKLLWAIAKSPGKIPALLRLQKNSSRAAQRLAEVLATMIMRDPAGVSS